MPNTWTMYEGKRVTLTYDQVGVSDGAPDWAKQEWRVTLRHNGKRMTFAYYGGAMAGNPNAEDVVADLAMNSSTVDMTFDDWCSDYGYDTDSRSALETYKLCARLGKRFDRLMA